MQYVVTKLGLNYLNFVEIKNMAAKKPTKEKTTLSKLLSQTRVQEKVIALLSDEQKKLVFDYVEETSGEKLVEKIYSYVISYLTNYKSILDENYFCLGIPVYKEFSLPDNDFIDILVKATKKLKGTYKKLYFSYVQLPNSSIVITVESKYFDQVYG